MKKNIESYLKSSNITELNDELIDKISTKISDHIKDKLQETFLDMRMQYKNMNSGDLQSIAFFIQMMNGEEIKERISDYRVHTMKLALKNKSGQVLIVGNSNDDDMKGLTTKQQLDNLFDMMSSEIATLIGG